MTDGYLSKRAAARWLDVSEKTIDRLRAAGELEALKLTDGPGGHADERRTITRLEPVAGHNPPQPLVRGAEPRLLRRRLLRPLIAVLLHIRRITTL